MFVIATAGHIDHGKSTLVRLLTGTNPDRLKEEVERGMTIDLGFSYFTLPSGRHVGVVDVPGHHRFIKNMLAGVGGVHLTLFVVAATESWMPQSQEHLEILDLLGIARGIVVLTKMDLVEEEWLEMVEEDVRERVAGSVLEHAPIVKVSSTTGEGLEALIAAVDDALSTVPAAVDIGRPRLWVDRVFTVKGSGTVVTGTLQGGAFRLEDELDVIPGGHRVRVRALQTHNRQVTEAAVGGRVAVNVAGYDVDSIERGDALVHPESVLESTCLYALIRTVASLKRPVTTGAELKVYLGTAERMARVKLLDCDVLEADQSGLAQIELDRPVAAMWRDRFILRDPAHQVTVGGGRVAQAPARRVRGKDHRFYRQELSERHQVLVGVRTPERLDLNLVRLRLTEEPLALLEAMLKEEGWVDRQKVKQAIPAPVEVVEKAIARSIDEDGTIALKSVLVEAGAWERLKELTCTFLGEYHTTYPLRSGTPRETLRSHLGIGWRLFDESVERWVEEGLLVAAGARIRLADHDIRLSEQQRRIADHILAALNAAAYTPPSVDELIADVDDGDELLGFLVEQGEVVRIAKGLVYAKDAFEEIRRQVVEHLEREGSIDVAHMRDMLGTSRKYTVPLLEYLDQIEVTRRVGDRRVLGLRARQ